LGGRNGDVKLDPAGNDGLTQEGIASNAVHVVQYRSGHNGCFSIKGCS
jgi:hypothetical protein